MESPLRIAKPDSVVASVPEFGSFRCVCFRRLRRGFNDVQATLGLGKPGPAAGPRVFSRADGACAMRATDAGIVLIMKLVVRHVVIVDVTPHLL